MSKIIIGITIVIFFFTYNTISANEIIVPNEAIRLRVIANSNSEYDQHMKMMVKQEVQENIYTLLSDTKNTSEAREIIKKNIDFFDNNLKTFLDQKNYSIGYSIDFGNFYFKGREDKGIVYDEGYYESLLVKLGKAEGDNWWCVLFPPLCLLEAHESTEVEYKFFVHQLIEKYFK